MLAKQNQTQHKKSFHEYKFEFNECFLMFTFEPDVQNDAIFSENLSPGVNLN